jgi:hypothetical protein
LIFSTSTRLARVVDLVRELPNALGIVGTLFLFYGCVTPIAETLLALRSVKSEMEFTLMLRAKYQERRAAETAVTEKEAARPGVSFHPT